jgi:putative membrane protein
VAAPARAREGSPGPGGYDRPRRLQLSSSPGEKKEHWNDCKSNIRQDVDLLRNGPVFCGRHGAGTGPATRRNGPTTATAHIQPGQLPGQPGQNPTAGPGTTTPTEASLADQAFVSSVFESDAAEEHLGQLAQQKSQSPDVKELGQKMMENRTKLDEQLKPVAQKLDIREPKKPSKKEKELMAKLEALSGPQFDEEYLRAVAKNNQDDVKNFQTEAESASDPTLQATAKEDAPVLAANQQAVEKIAQTHNVAMDEKK